MIFTCCDERRRAAVLGNPTLNGIDYLEVLDHDAIAIPSPRQQTLLITCLKPPPAGLTANNVLITGGESITGIVADWIAPATAPPPMATPAEAAFFAALPNAANVLVVRVNEWGDFSPYVFRLVDDAAAAQQANFHILSALSGFDPQLTEVQFSFKVECGPDFDCAPTPADCAPDLPTPPPINYLAKDYGSFRQVMLDRMNQLLPSWGAATEADIGVMLAELVSYAGDQLSYRQDAVTTEAYLPTARSRISLRRHARLVDYRVHEGCNARVWVQISVSAVTFLDRSHARFYTLAPGAPASLEVGSNNEEAALVAGVVAFEAMQSAFLYPEHNSISLYTWGDSDCCLPAGATSATLKGPLPNLAIGDVLIFQEMMGPQTGFPADADVRHRCAVRLTAVAQTDASGQPLVDPLFDVNGDPITGAGQTPQPVVEIQWASDDALAFPVCVSARFLGSDGLEHELADVSVALGNVILADQGLTMSSVSLGTVPSPRIPLPPAAGADRCELQTQKYLPVRFRPKIADSPLTWAVALPLAGSPSTSAPTPLLTSGPVSLTDAAGIVSLMVSADAPLQWPQYFGVIATPNANPAVFDLAVVFAPPGGPAGLAAPAVLERFTGLSLTTADPAYAGAQLASSRFIRVPTSFTPTAAVPTAFPPGPAMLPLAGTVDLADATSNPYLTITPTNPLGWPPLFAVVAQGDLSDPNLFNLLLLYSPPSAEGVTLPIVAEQFLSISLANIGAAIASGSDLISVQTFEEGPNPSLAAADLMAFDAQEAAPVITLAGTLDAAPVSTWTAATDLLAAGPTDTEFVVEIDTDGTASIRFGDDTNGERPQTGMAFSAVYRIGNGTVGNVGANCLVKFAAGPLANSTILSCTNPLPATGGIDPETNEQIRRRAPQAFMTQERAITMQDYAAAVELNPQVEDAAAIPRWTGSWYTVFITAEPCGNGPMSRALRENLTRTVNRYRLAGQDILLEPPQYVSLDIALSICVAPDYFALDVEKQLLQVLGSRALPNGQPALFSPLNFELGQPVYLSPIYAAARSVAGVQTVVASVFEPQGQNTEVYLQQGYIPMGPFQVARLANDRSLPGNGRLSLTMEGGR